MESFFFQAEDGIRDRSRHSCWNRSSDLVNKKSDMDLAAKGLGAKEWNNSLKTKLSLLPKKLFRIRMSRNFGMKMLTMTNLSTECLIQLTKLGCDATPFNQILKQNRSEERFSRNAETDLVCRLLLEKKKKTKE